MAARPDLLMDLEISLLRQVTREKAQDLAAAMSAHPQPDAKNAERIRRRLISYYDRLIREEQRRPVKSTTS